MGIIQDIENKQIKKDVPSFNVGDTVRVFSKIIEGDKERLQAFEGTVIKKRGGGVRAVLTVRKVVQGIGVERTFPVNSPKVDKIKVIKSGQARRAKLYYLRKRIGSRALKVEDAQEQQAPAAAPSAEQQAK